MSVTTESLQLGELCNAALQETSPRGDTRKLTVVGICGHNRAGKDTVAGVLASAAGFHRVALADGVREAFGGLDGPTWEFRKDLDAAGGNREAMKVLGTECREDAGSRMHWVDHALIKIRYASKYHPNRRTKFVVPDIRFPHEPERLAAVVAMWGGRLLMVKVERPGCGVTTGHASETAIDAIKADYTLKNDGGRDKLVKLASNLAIFAGAGS